MEISDRLSVEGPDRDGDYEFTLRDCGCDSDQHSHYITREQADALIAALESRRWQETLKLKCSPTNDKCR